MSGWTAGEDAGGSLRGRVHADALVDDPVCRHVEDWTREAACLMARGRPEDRALAAEIRTVVERSRVVGPRVCLALTHGEVALLSPPLRVDVVPARGGRV